MSDSEAQNESPDTLPARTTYTLDQLVEGITEENRHAETDWGLPVGREAW